VPRSAPDPVRLPDKVWNEPATLDLCRRHDANGLLRLARKYGGTNEAVGYWTGIDPVEISKRTTPGGAKANSPIRALDRWQRLADGLDMPDHARALIGLAPRASTGEEAAGSGLARRTVLRGAVVGLGLSAVAERLGGPADAEDTAGGSDDSAGLMEKGCAEWLAWQMWQSGTTELHVSDLPAPIARYLNAETRSWPSPLVSPGGLIACTVDGVVTFVRPEDADLFVGHRVFRGIADGNSSLLGAGQTTHRTDLVVQQYVAQHDASVRALRDWSCNSTDSLVRVNSGGILAKLGRDDLVDEVAVSLAHHTGARILYLTAVLNRVLDLPWDDAAGLAARTHDAGALSASLAAGDLDRLAAELSNTRDGVARWCAALVLGACGTPSDSVRSSLQRALLTERSRENLRAVGTALSGTTPIVG
jgi:hypothetical protein